MPLHVQPVSRRAFLSRSIALGVGAFLGAPLLTGCASSSSHAFKSPPAPAGSNLEHWALVSDPHVAADVRATRGGVNMADNLRQVVSDIVEWNATPVGAIVNGDCARLTGQRGDYETFHKLFTRPLTDGGIPVHLALGNHDHRGRFEQSLRTFETERGQVGAPLTALDGRYVSVVQGRFANFFLLDSLSHTSHMHGCLGPRQLHWLDSALARLDDKPALIFGHHPLDGSGGALDFLGDLTDGRQLWQVLTRHDHVKGYFYGHTHRWDITERQGIFLVNLPCTSYPFKKSEPAGWVEMLLGPNGAELRLRPVRNVKVASNRTVATIEWAGVTREA